MTPDRKDALRENHRCSELIIEDVCVVMSERWCTPVDQTRWKTKKEHFVIKGYTEVRHIKSKKLPHRGWSRLLRRLMQWCTHYTSDELEACLPRDCLAIKPRAKCRAWIVSFSYTNYIADMWYSGARKCDLRFHSGKQNNWDNSANTLKWWDDLGILLRRCHV